MMISGRRSGRIIIIIVIIMMATVEWVEMMVVIVVKMTTKMNQTVKGRQEKISEMEKEIEKERKRPTGVTEMIIKISRLPIVNFK